MAGMQETLKAADKGMALFAAEAKLEFATDEAQAFKDQHELAMKAVETEMEGLSGKENKKARTEKSKELSALKVDKKYIDACKVVKGLEAPNGNFMKKIEAAAPQSTEPAKETDEKAANDKKDDDKKEKKPKKTESAGISKAERDELEKLKTDITTKKAELKASGLSGGQCNKDPEVVKMVARMQELKIKEDPSLAEGEKKPEEKKKVLKIDSEEKQKLKDRIEEYRMQLKTEFGYSDKEIKADPDMQDLQKSLAKMK